MRAAPFPVTLVVEAQLEDYSFESLTSLTSHIETLVLGSIYVPRTNDEDCVPNDLMYYPFPKMKLPGLKKVKIVGDDLPVEYILTCFSAIYNAKLPNISLHMERGEELDLVELVSHPIFKKIHTIDIATSEFVIIQSKNCLTIYPRHLFPRASSG